MTPARRVFVLLGVYEDLSDRECRALRRGDIDFALNLGQRKRRLSQAICAARQNAMLSAREFDALQERVRILEQSEKQNLEFLAEQMARARAGLQALNMATQRTRQVRRGYVREKTTHTARTETILGSA